jgi:hypothetical protein
MWVLGLHQIEDREDIDWVCRIGKEEEEGRGRESERDRERGGRWEREILREREIEKLWERERQREWERERERRERESDREELCCILYLNSTKSSNSCPMMSWLWGLKGRGGEVG